MWLLQKNLPNIVVVVVVVVVVVYAKEIMTLSRGKEDSVPLTVFSH